MKTVLQKDVCTPIFIAALLIITKIGKQPKCPSIDDWVKKVFYIYMCIGFPGVQTVKNLPAMQEMCHWFDPWVGKIPWRTAWQPTSVFLPGVSHGQRSLAGYSP